MPMLPIQVPRHWLRGVLRASNILPVWWEAIRTLPAGHDGGLWRTLVSEVSIAIIIFLGRKKCMRIDALMQWFQWAS